MDDQLINLLITAVKLGAFLMVFLVFTKTKLFKNIIKKVYDNDKNK